MTEIEAGEEMKTPYDFDRGIEVDGEKNLISLEVLQSSSTRRFFFSKKGCKNTYHQKDDHMMTIRAYLTMFITVPE